MLVKKQMVHQCWTPMHLQYWRLQHGPGISNHATQLHLLISKYQRLPRFSNSYPFSQNISVYHIHKSPIVQGLLRISQTLPTNHSFLILIPDEMNMGKSITPHYISLNPIKYYMRRSKTLFSVRRKKLKTEVTNQFPQIPNRTALTVVESKPT